MKTIKDDVKTPTKIANGTGIRHNHIFKVLTEFKQAEIAKCINKKAKKDAFTDWPKLWKK